MHETVHSATLVIPQLRQTNWWDPTDFGGMLTEYPPLSPPPEDGVRGLPPPISQQAAQSFSHLPPPPPQQFVPPPQIGRTGTNPTAVISFLFSIFGFFICGVGALVGPILGFRALREIKRSNGRQSGRGLAIAGIVIGFIVFAAFVITALGSLAGL